MNHRKWEKKRIIYFSIGHAFEYGGEIHIDERQKKIKNCLCISYMTKVEIIWNNIEIKSKQYEQTRK